ncbi:MAG: carbohydrate porin [Comamonas sp.]
MNTPFPLRATVTAIALVTAALLSASMAHAADTATAADETAATRTEWPNERIGPRVQNPEPSVPAGDTRPLAGAGRWLNDHGITPHLGLTYMAYGNPSTGLYTGKSEALALFSAGADFDLSKIAGIPGGTLHFEQLYVPYTHNLSYGQQVGGVLAGDIGPYIPGVSHLTLFTYEQKLLDNRLSLEAGKSNAGNYFALPLCNVPVTCVNSLLQKTAGFNPPPYANWSARASYDFTPALRAQVGAWRSDASFPFTNGWERRGVGTLSTSYLGNVVYRTDASMDRYPRTYEALLFYNNGTQTNPYYTTAGTSQLVDTVSAARTSEGAGGFYLGAKQTFWRADGGSSDNPSPTTLAAWASLTHTFNPDATAGIATMGRTGLILSAPWRSRPFDSYGLSLGWSQLTRAKQRLLIDSQEEAGGSTYGISRNEYSLTLDANFVLDRGVILSPYAMRVWNASSYANASTGSLPRDGWAVGLLLHVQLEDWLGLSGSH